MSSESTTKIGAINIACFDGENFVDYRPDHDCRWLVFYLDRCLLNDRFADQIRNSPPETDAICQVSEPSVLRRSIWGARSDEAFAPAKAISAEYFNEQGLSTADPLADMKAVFSAKNISTIPTEFSGRRLPGLRGFWLWCKRGNHAITLGMIISVICLVFVFAGVSSSAVAASIADLDLGLIAISMIACYACLLARVFRWKILYDGIAKIRFDEAASITFAGVGFNNLLPARAGEFGRAFMLKRLTGIDAAAALGTIVIERIIDVFFAVILIATGAAILPSGDAVAYVRIAAAFVAFLAVSISVFLFFSDRFIERISSLGKTGAFAARLASSLLLGIKISLRPPVLIKCIGLSVLAWALIFISYEASAAAVASVYPKLPELWSLLYVGSVNLSMAIPSAPGGLGPVEAVAVSVLELYKINRVDAIAFAIVSHGVQYACSISTGLAGFLYWFAFVSKRGAPPKC